MAKRKCFFTFLYQKVDFFLIFLTRTFAEPPKMERISIYSFTFVWQILAKNLPNCRLFSAKARVVCRNKHFISPQSVTQLSAYRRILVLIPEKFLPKGKILPCFFPHDFLFEAKKALPPEKQKDSRVAWWLTCPASLGARTSLPACFCQAKAAFR